MESSEAAVSPDGSLYPQHEQLGAKFGQFAGSAMPLEYAGGGVLAEHAAVRERVGAFDVSHMGTLVVSGRGAVAALNGILTNDLGRIGPGGAQYSLLCAENDVAGVVDDLLVYVRSGDEAMIVPNAANAPVVADIIRAGLAGTDVTIDDVGARTAIVAVQGPLSAQVLQDLGVPADHDYLTFVDATGAFGPLTVARTGYTGEHGYELIIPVTSAVEVWDAIVQRCLAHGGLPCGLGARDTLRLEMGYPLHGQDLTLQTSPVQAGLSWAVGWDKPRFHGREQLLQERAEGPPRRLRALACIDRAVPRSGMQVYRRADSEDVVGELTSGTFSPTLRRGIALAMLSSDVGIGDEVHIDVRGRRARAEVVRAPFVNADPRT